MNTNDKGMICAKTWEKDSHGLYDYEQSHVRTNVFNDIKDGSFIRYHMTNEVMFKPKAQVSISSDDQFLVNLSIQNDKKTLFKQVNNHLPINNKTLTDLQEQIWHVVKDNSYEYELKKNDIIKLGRIKFVVKDMNIVDGHTKSSIETFIPYYDNDTNKATEESLCRICYSLDVTEDNPMISVCKCKGSMNLHLYCLKKWLESKLTMKEINRKPGVSYTIKSFNCEICYEPYPITIKNHEAYYNLINYTVPENQNFIILQSLNSVKENEYPLSVHVLMFIENESAFTLGRGHESDIRISDISVSRLHARIYMKNNKFYMEDKGSKFGTLVLAKGPVDLSGQYMYQIGRTLMYYKTAKNKEESLINKFVLSEEEIDKVFNDGMEALYECGKNLDKQNIDKKDMDDNQNDHNDNNEKD